MQEYITSQKSTTNTSKENFNRQAKKLRSVQSELFHKQSTKDMAHKGIDAE